jgi:hypothetical protein
VWCDAGASCTFWGLDDGQGPSEREGGVLRQGGREERRPSAGYLRPRVHERLRSRRVRGEEEEDVALTGSQVSMSR